jgi:hypothetical protein
MQDNPAIANQGLKVKLKAIIRADPKFPICFSIFFSPVEVDPFYHSDNLFQGHNNYKVLMLPKQESCQNAWAEH